MTWEESVNLWGEEGEVHRGRIRLQNSSFLHADELTCFDDTMVICPLESFEDGPLKGYAERVQSLNKPIPIRCEFLIYVVVIIIKVH
ncbi:hypothetical protein TSUD_293320 [Trifolium subterraneum]|uniref:Uncharacterized protein n=1 Tax=Trifolium subterraneum TaxID=3900 RepID=A0A2Z6MYS7_TRISU|nr:hypothetical protein TSUD_293320 [Trifolium subterraneum]